MRSIQIINFIIAITICQWSLSCTALEERDIEDRILKSSSSKSSKKNKAADHSSSRLNKNAEHSSSKHHSARATPTEPSVDSPASSPSVRSSSVPSVRPLMYPGGYKNPTFDPTRAPTPEPTIKPSDTTPVMYPGRGRFFPTPSPTTFPPTPESTTAAPMFKPGYSRPFTTPVPAIVPTPQPTPTPTTTPPFMYPGRGRPTTPPTSPPTPEPTYISILPGQRPPSPHPTPYPTPTPTKTAQPTDFPTSGPLSTMPPTPVSTPMWNPTPFGLPSNGYPYGVQYNKKKTRAVLASRGCVKCYSETYDKITTTDDIENSCVGPYLFVGSSGKFFMGAFNQKSEIFTTSNGRMSWGAYWFYNAGHNIGFNATYGSIYWPLNGLPGSGVGEFSGVESNLYRKNIYDCPAF